MHIHPVISCWVTINELLHELVCTNSGWDMYDLIVD